MHRTAILENLEDHGPSRVSSALFCGFPCGLGVPGPARSFQDLHGELDASCRPPDLPARSAGDGPRTADFIDLRFRQLSEYASDPLLYRISYVYRDVQR